MEEDEVDLIINDFLGNLNLVESEVVHEKRKRIRHVHWWDGWEDKPKSEPEKDFEALNLQLNAILECIGDADCKKGIMEELRKRAMTDKMGKSVKDLMLTIFEMASLASGFSLNERINFASRVYKMLHAKLLIEEEERANVMSVGKEDEGEKAFGMSKNEDSNDLLLRIEKVEPEWTALTVVEKCQDFHVVAHPENGEAHFGDRGVPREQNVDKSVVLFGKNGGLLSVSFCMPLQKDEEFMIALEGLGCLCHEPGVMERPLNDLVFVDKCTYSLCDAINTGGYGYGNHGMGRRDKPQLCSTLIETRVSASCTYRVAVAANARKSLLGKKKKVSKKDLKVIEMAKPHGNPECKRNMENLRKRNKDIILQSRKEISDCAAKVTFNGALQEERSRFESLRGQALNGNDHNNNNVERCLVGDGGFESRKGQNVVNNNSGRRCSAFCCSYRRGAAEIAEKTKGGLLFLIAGDSYCFSYDAATDKLAANKGVGRQDKMVSLSEVTGLNNSNIPREDCACNNDVNTAENNPGAGMRVTTEAGGIHNSNISNEDCQLFYACYYLVVCTHLVQFLKTIFLGMQLQVALAIQMDLLLYKDNDILYDTSLKGSHEIGIHEGVSHAHIGNVIHECNLMHVNVVRKLFGDMFFDSGLFWRRLIRSVREQRLAIFRSLTGMVLL